MNLDEGAGRRQQRHPVPVPLPKAYGAEKAAVQGGMGSLEALRPHVLVLEDFPKQAPHLRVRSPIRDRLQIVGEEADQMVMLGRVAPDLPPRELPCREASQKRVGHGRMGLDFLSELPGKLAGRHGRGTR